MKEDWEIQTVLLEVDAVTYFQDLSNCTGMSVVIMFFLVGMSVVITYVLHCWYVCDHYLCSSLLVCVVCGHYLCSSLLVSLWSLLMFFGADMSVVITYVLQCWYVCGHYFCSSVLVCLWSLLMFFSVSMSVVITYVLQCWYVCGHYLFSSVLIDFKDH